MWQFFQGEFTKNESKRESDRRYNGLAKLVYTRDIFLVVVYCFSEKSKWPMKLQGRKKNVESE